MATTTTTPPPGVADRTEPAASTAGRPHPVSPARPTPPERARECHALVARLPDPVGAPEIRRRLERVARRWPALRVLRLWETSVPAPRDAPAARERTHREAQRPVRDVPAPLRAVLLQYADGVADLVLVALRRRISRALLGQIADAMTAGSDPAAPARLRDAPAPEPARWAAVEWGLADPSRAGVIGTRPLALPPLTSRRTEALLGAVALTLSRYSGERTVELGLLDADDDPPEPALVRLEEIDEELGPTGCLSRLGTALTDASAAGAGLPAVGVLVSAAEDDRVYLPCLSPPFPLTVQVVGHPDGSAEAVCRFDEGSISAPVAEDFGASVARLAGWLAESAGGPALSTVPLMEPAETARVRRLGGVARRGEGRIDRRFQEVARRFPDAAALADDTGELTYRRLDERANAVAAGLRTLGVARGRKVGICLDRDASLVIAMLGILKAGCAYVPMDLRYPPDRLRYIAEDARLALVIADPERFPAIAGVRAVPLDDLSLSGGRGHSVPGPSGTGDDAAYVIYTSGSTGRPKGVVVPHRNVISLLEATATEFALGPDDVWTLFHSSAFDFSVWETWGCLLTGGRLVVVPYWTARDTDGFRRLLAERRVTVLNQTPSAFSQLLRADRDARQDLSLRLLIFGGEPLDVRLLAPWFARYSHTRCRVVNMYGITETTVHVTAQTVTPADLVAGSRSVGRALPGWSVSVRDARGRVLPPGAAGEIYVAGAGVADGYLDRPELTAQRFVVDGDTGERLYRSGDRGRLRPDGRLDHLGRLDNQVKIRGHRVELDEIRSVLAADPRVSAAVVVVRQTSPGDPAGSRIDGYVVLGERSDTRSILADARTLLPDYMTPATLTEIPSIPLTANGKPDTSRLPPPAAGPGRAGRPPDGAAGSPTSGGLAEEVLRIWSHCLHTEVTADDNFFELGGNSLLVLRVITAMREKGLPQISPRDFYMSSTAGQFVGLLQERHESEGQTFLDGRPRHSDMPRPNAEEGAEHGRPGAGTNARG